MNILFINKFLYPKGGDSIVALETGRLFSDKGHNVQFWGMSHPLNSNYDLSKYFVRQTEYDKLGGLKEDIRVAGNVLFSYEAAKKVEDVIVYFKPDIVHLHNFAHQISPSILYPLKKHNIPIVMTMHDYKLVCPIYTLLRDGILCELCKNRQFFHCAIHKCAKGSFLKSLLSTSEMYLHHNILNIYKLIDVFISPSRFLQQKVRECGLSGRIEYVPNFVDSSFFTPQYVSNSKIIIYFGRLSSEKGILFLANQAKNFKEYKFHIIGDGPLLSQLKDNASLIPNLELFGHMDINRLKDYIRNALFVVMPSLCYENNPRAILEAFALGKPVLGSRIGGIPELVQDGITGLTYMPGDGNDFKIKFQELVSDIRKIESLGKNARISVEHNFNKVNYYNSLMGIYESIL